MTSKVKPGAVDLLPRELLRLYHELAKIGGRVEGRQVRWRLGPLSREDLVVLTAQTSRQDPRLLWVLVEWLAEHFVELDLLALRRANGLARWPAALAVAFEFARRARPSEELSEVMRFLFGRTPKALNEQYFIGNRAFGGALARREGEESLAEYKRWGFLSREEPLSKELGATARGTLGPAERRNLLRRIASRDPEFALADYLEALQGRASPRQASRDLAQARFLRRRGTTKGTRYALKRPR